MAENLPIGVCMYEVFGSQSFACFQRRCLLKCLFPYVHMLTKTKKSRQKLNMYSFDETK